VGTVSEQKWEKHVEVAMSFTMLVNKLWAGVFSCIHPGIFHQTFGSLHKQFANYRQHDCQEFIAFLLDSLHEILTLNVLMRRQDYLTSLTLPEGNCGEDRMVVDDACEQSQLQDGMFKADSYRTENMGENEAKERIGAIEGCEEKGKREAKEGCEEKNTKISVITSTLQGTFKSLVECLACEHVSVTFEPFMYLSLPIPRAMERQIVVTFVPSMSLLPPIRYMVTVHKAHFVANLKTALIEMLPEDSKPDQKDVVLTEVYCWSIARILDDTFPLRFITSALRHLVAFEIIKMSSSQLQTAEMTDSCQNPVSLLKPSETETCEPKTDAECVITTADINPCETGNDCGDMNSNLDGETNNGNVPLRFDALNSTELLVPISSPVIVEQSTLSASSASLSTAMADIVVGLSASLAGSLWHTCAICLEEMLERELMTHPLCGCMLCQPCLEMTKNHHGGSTFICPVCLKAVDADAGFVCMSVGSQEREIRNLCIPVEFKQVSPEQEGSRLEQVNFVALLQLSSISTPQDLYQKVSEMLCQKIGNVNSLTFTVHVAYGLFSSYQSLIEQHPDVLSTGRDIVELRPSDTVCVVFSSSLTQEMKTKLCAVVDHCSVQSKISQTWTLADCLEAFIKSEELGDENTWFCPHCCANQKARKTLLLWKLPSTLIVHLKRFVFEGMCGEKIDVAVDCPLEQLDMSQYVIEDNHGCPLVYDLISYVCHSGGWYRKLL
jgi:ubiquitin carboxyl-terminal hydrolase 4/11/15